MDLTLILATIFSAALATLIVFACDAWERSGRHACSMCGKRAAVFGVGRYWCRAHWETRGRLMSDRRHER